MERFYERRLLSFAYNHVGHIIAKRFFFPGWEHINANLIQLINKDEYQFPSEKSNLTYIVNSAIGTCSCPTGISGAPCKHQGAVAAKYHIGAINFLPSITANDCRIYSYIANGLNTMDYSFFASLHPKPAITEDRSQISSPNLKLTNINSINFEKTKELGLHEFEGLEQVDNSLKIGESQHHTNNLLEIKESVHQENNSQKIKKLEHEANDSFFNFLQEVKENYEKLDPQLCTALNKFAERYEAAKSQSIPRLATFLYDLNRNLDPSACTKGGKDSFSSRIHKSEGKRKAQVSSEKLVKKMIRMKFLNANQERRVKRSTT